ETVANPPTICSTATWSRNAVTVAGGKESGTALNQLSWPSDIFVDDDRNVFVADLHNFRIVKYLQGETTGQLILSGRSFSPVALFVDQNKNLYVSDTSTHSVKRWAEGVTDGGELILDNRTNQFVVPYGIYVDKSGILYTSDWQQHQVLKWNLSDSSRSSVVAGGHGNGSASNQLNEPGGIWVNEADETVYIADTENHRIQRWSPSSSTGVTVAGGNKNGTNLNQLIEPSSVTIDGSGNVYVSDIENHRVMQWPVGSKEGRIIAGTTGSAGTGPDQLNLPDGIQFDKMGNLYVADLANGRVQMFTIIGNDCNGGKSHL
ncbi:unnamed protein product, partial [Didymodactylos carnosus]